MYKNDDGGDISIVAGNDYMGQQCEMLNEAYIEIEEAAARVEALCKWAGYPLSGLPQWEEYSDAWSNLQRVIGYWKSPD
jgi:hypothetical protein